MKTLRTAGMVVAAVALVATGVGALAGAGVLGAAAMGSAGVVAGISTATISAVGMYASLAAGVIGLIGAAAQPKASTQGSQTSFTTNPQSGLPYAMGRTRMSGLRFFADTNTRPGYTKFNDLLWFGALLTIGGQIEGIEKFTGDNEAVTFAADGNAIGTYHDYQAQKVHTGGPMASALAVSLGGGTAPGWTSAHKLSGITHAMWCLRYNKQGEMYGAGAPEPAWIGKWVKVYDPRLDSTYPGGSGSCRALDETTYVWSDNPGLHALTWSLGRWQNGKRTCGIGAPIANIRVEEFVECANVCEANAWKVGGVEWTTDSKWDTLKRILQAGGAMPTKTGAMIGCMVYTPRVAIATIESWHLHDGASFPMTKSRRDRFNTVIPRYVDEASEWSVISGTAITEPAYVAADRGQRTKEIDFPLVQVFSGQQAKQPGQLAAYEIVNSREAGPWSFVTGPQWIGLQTGDVVNLNVPDEGIVNQPVLITRRSIDPSTGKVSFTVQTETPMKHAYALGQSTTPPAPFSLSAPDLKPPAPTETEWSITGATSGEGFPALLVAGVSEMPSADAIVIDYRLHTAGETPDAGWTNSAILSAVDTVRHVIAPLESQTAYDVRISYRVGTIDGDTTIFEQVVTGVGKITTIENQLQNHDEALAQLDEDIEKAETDIATARGTIAQMQVDAADTKAALEADISSIDAITAQIQADAADTRTSLESAQASISAQGNSILQAQADIVAAGGRITSIESSLGDQDASITSLAQTVSNHTGRLATVESTVTAHGASISQNAQAISTVQGDVASLTTRVRAANPNLLKNGGFENGMTNWTVTNGGPFTSYLSGSWGTVARTTANVGNGAYVTLMSDPVIVYQIPHTLSVEAAFYISGGTGVGYTEIIWYAANGTELRHDFGPQLTATFDFTIEGTGRRLMTWTATPPANTGYARIILTARKDSGVLTSLDWRQVKFEASALATPYSSEAQIVQTATAVSTLNGSVATLSSTVSTQGASITSLQTASSSQAGQIASLNTRVVTAESSISTNASAISTTNQNVASLTTRVASAEGSISSQASSITSLQGSMSTLSSTVSSQGSSISSLQSASTTQAGQIATLQTQVTAGNANLLSNGGFENGLACWTASLSPATWNVGVSGSWGLVAATNSAVANGSYVGLASPLIRVFPGSSHTLSGESAFFLNGGSGVAYLEIVWYNDALAQVGLISGPGRAANPNFDFTADGSGRRAMKLTATSPATAAWARVQLTARKDSGTITTLAWRQVKFEIGSVATPYSSEAQVASTASAVTTLNGNMATLSSTVSTQGSTISQQGTAITTLQGNYSTLSSTVTAQGSTISSQATAISNLQGQTSTLEMRVSAGTSPNLISNGSFENGLAGWADTTGWSPANANGWGYHAVLGSNVADGSYTYITSARAPIYPGSTYTVSGDLVQFINGGAGSQYLELLWFNSAGAYLSTAYGPTRVAGYDFDASGASRQVLKVTGQAPGNAAFAAARATFFKQNGVASGFGVRQMKLERGTVASAYSSEATVAQAFSALSTLTSQYASLSSTVSTQGVSVSQHSTAITTINGNLSTVMGQWGVELDVNGYVSGIKANNNGQRADFTVRSDRFRVIPPGGAGSDGFYVDIDGSGRTTQYILSGGVRRVEIGWIA